MTARTREVLHQRQSALQRLHADNTTWLDACRQLHCVGCCLLVQRLMQPLCRAKWLNHSSEPPRCIRDDGGCRRAAHMMKIIAPNRRLCADTATALCSTSTLTHTRCQSISAHAPTITPTQAHRCSRHRYIHIAQPSAVKHIPLQREPASSPVRLCILSHHHANSSSSLAPERGCHAAWQQR